MRLRSQPDHVAIAVRDVDRACDRWVGTLGAGLAARFHVRPIFRGVQLRFANGVKLELIEPSDLEATGATFLHRFLDRFGAGVHHVTLLVPHLPSAIETLRRAGLDVVDVDQERPYWKEAFLRPSQVGGLVVQIAWAAAHDPDAVPRPGFTPSSPRADAAALHGPVLVHPDLDAAAALWRLLGATTTPTADGFRATWDGDPFTLRVERGDRAGPRGLAFDGAPPLDAHPAYGPAVLPV